MTEKISTYTYNDLETICPYCGNAQESDCGESLPWTDSEETEIYCDDCDKEYAVTCSIMYSRESFKIDCKDDEHNLGEAEEGVDQELADRWNRENFLERSDHKPTYFRQCLDCEYREHVND